MENEFLYGIQVMLIGMGIVFASLLALSYVMVLLARIFGGEKKTVLGESSAPPPFPESAQIRGQPDEVPAEVVAVIAASIAAYLGTAPEGVKIRVVRRQILAPWSAWSMAGRQEQMNLRKLG